MKIAYLSRYSPADINAWSGTHYYMCESLKARGIEVTVLGPHEPSSSWRRWLRYARNCVLPRKRIDTFSPWRQRSHKLYFERKLREGGPFDAVLAVASTVELAMVDTSLPVIYINDSTFMQRFDYYPYYKGVCKSSYEDGVEAELSAIARSSAVIVPTEWAARSVANDCGYPRSRTFIIPFGANVSNPEIPPQDAKNGTFGLVFVGKEWGRKGGQKAYDCYLKLRETYNVWLTIVGCAPAGIDYSIATVIPFIDKSRQSDNESYKKIMASNHLLLLPATAECFGIVICEAFAHGLPVFASNTGGIPCVVEHGVTGRLFAVDASPGDYCSAIESIIDNREEYQGMSERARDAYEKRFSWQRWAEEVSVVIEGAAI